jgi:hypothetical protein
VPNTAPSASTATPVAPNSATRAAFGERGTCGVASRPASTTGGGVTLIGRARSGNGTRVFVGNESTGGAGVTSPSISVRSGRSTGGPLSVPGFSDGIQPGGVSGCACDMRWVVLPSNDGAVTRVVFGAELTAKGSAVLAESVT